MASNDLINSVDINNPSNTRRSVDLLPMYHRTDKNTKFLASTLDQYIQQPQIERVNGYIGSKLTPNFDPTTDQYIKSNTKLRTDYQFEPSMVITEIDGNISTVFGYDDLIGQLTIKNASTSNLDRVFRPNSFSYDPHIDWDKFVNFRQYYWLPTGPDTIEISGQQASVTSTYFVSDSVDNKSLIFSTEENTANPLITLYKGQTYIFNVISAFPFYIKSAYVEGIQDLVPNVVGQGTKNGQVIINVDDYTPSTLYYFAEGNATAVGKIVIKSIIDDTKLDINADIIGKQNYTSNNGVAFSNGMKVRFVGNIFPENFIDKDFFIEGVGTSITLVDYSKLQIIKNQKTNLDVNFDATLFDQFPFDDFENVPLIPEYISINRSSPDRNLWSNYNRWVHIDVINATAKANGTFPIFSENKRATRPIIEFNAGLQLYNYGSYAIDPVDLIDTITTDPFTAIEGFAEYYVDQILIESGFRIIFNAATDPLVKGKIYDVKIDVINGNLKINFEESLNSIPTIFNSVIVTNGITNIGTSWWFNGIEWVYGQQKISLNQFPIFELYDQQGYRYADQNYYNSNFHGTKVFGYKIGSVFDSTLGFSLSYRNNTNLSEYLFENFYMTETFTNFINNSIIVVNVSDGFLKVNKLNGSEFKTVWTKTIDKPIPIIQYQVIEQQITYIEIVAIDNPGTISDLTLEIFVNNVKQHLDFDYKVKINGTHAFVVSNTTFLVNDTVLFKLYTSAVPNEHGYYEPPINLTNNPLNGPISEFSFTELSDHVNTIANNCNQFIGKFPGNGNLRDLSNIGSFGSRLVCHSNPISFAHYFLSTPDDNLIISIRKVAEDYNQFKINLLRNITLLETVYSTTQTLDDALKATVSANKNTDNYNFSDMIAFGTDYNLRSYTVTNPTNVQYSLESTFNDLILSERCLLVYLNNKLLIKGYDYFINQYDPSIKITHVLVKGDKIEIRDYPSTVGSFIPPTSTKLGLYPKFKPQIFIDNTYHFPQTVIQGHDGSLTIAYGDYRDNVFLEYEIRVFNNIKVSYNANFLDINEVMPGAFRPLGYNNQEIINMFCPDFLRWTSNNGVDYKTNSTFNELNTFSFNYTGTVDSLFQKPLTGYWRNVFKYFYDTDRPHTHPWEMLGFSEFPTWWESVYGPAPYTNGNLILWNDLELGRNALTGKIDPIYARPGLSKIIPVDKNGNLLSPTTSTLSTTLTANLLDTKRIIMLRSDQISASWKIGDQGPAETAWRRSSWWPFACQIILALSTPAKYCALFFDTSRVSKNIAGEYRYGTTNTFLNPTKVLLFSDIVNGSRVLAAGYSVFVIEHGISTNKNYLNESLKPDLKNITYQLMAKLGGFASKNKLRIGIDAVDPTTSEPGVLLPSEDYEIFYNISQPIESIGISGIIVQKTTTGWSIRGYDRYNPYFTVFRPFLSNDNQLFRVGGKSETYTVWTPDTTYSIDQIIFFNDRYYRVLQKHTTTLNFIQGYYQSLPFLPIIGGVGVLNRTNFDTSTKITIPYGAEYTSEQDVYDFIVGYGKWLESVGFIFDEFQNDLQIILDWDFTAKEFLYWTTQNWAVNSVITLSPFANQLTFQSSIAVVDNILNSFYEYSLLKADGALFPKTNFSIVRLNGQFKISTVNTQEGLFFAKLNLIQKEHAVVFKNYTLFNDVIYDVESGYRQRRIKINGFLTSNWNGDFFSPGFIFDQAIFVEWSRFTDYKIGEVVQFSNNYYSAKKSIVGAGSFDITQWVQLNNKPTPQLLPNFDYKINQFDDFYSLDIDNFDVNQQAMAQHLIGYTPRPYLNFIISDPIAQYKFYQGMIRDKGTINAITKLSKATINTFQSSIELNEEWAFRIGQFGGFNTYSELETRLESSAFIENPQIIEFTQSKPTVQNENIYYRDLTDILLSPSNFNISSIFATTTTTDLFELPIAGYVRIDDITATAYNKNSVLDIANNQSLKKGETIWIGFKENHDWDVLRITELHTVIISVSINIPGQSLFINTYYPHNLSIGELISITGIEKSINRCYIVQQITSYYQFVVLSTLSVIPPLHTPLTGLIFAFKTSRMNTFDNISEIKNLDLWNYEEKVWVDSDEDNQWSVYKKINNYTSLKFLSPIGKFNDNVVSNQFFGQKIAGSDNSNIVIVSAPNFHLGELAYGNVFVLYTDAHGSFQTADYFSVNDIYNTGYVSGQTKFGQSLAFDATNLMVVAGAPTASNVRSTFDSCESSFIIDNSSSLNNAQDQGVVKLLRLNPNSFKILPDSQVITTSESQTGTNFGWSLALSTPVINTTTFKVNSTASIQIGQLLTGTNILGLPIVTSIHNNNIAVSVAQTINTCTDLYFNTIVSGLTNYQNTTTISVAGTSSISLNSFVQNEFIGTTTQVIGIGEGIVIVNLPVSLTTSSLITFLNTSTLGYTLGTQQRLLVGAPAISNGTNTTISNDINLIHTGSVFIFDIEIQNSDSFVISKDCRNDMLSPSTNENEYFGADISGNSLLTRVAITSPYYQGSVANGAIYIYDFATSPDVKQIITSTDLILLSLPMTETDFFANKVKMSSDGNFLIVASPYSYDPIVKRTCGVVDTFKWNTSLEKFEHNQRINVPVSALTTNTVFGFDIDLNSTGEILVISAIGESKTINPTFDKFTKLSDILYVNDPTSLERINKTTFDGNSTTWSSKIKNGGSAHVYNKLGKGSTKWSYAQPLIDSNIAEGSMYGYSVNVLNNSVFIGAPASTFDNSTGTNFGVGQVFEYNKIDINVNSWKLHRNQSPLIDLSPITRAITINTLNDQIQDYIDIIDPIKGKISGIAKAELRYISQYDPAVYSLGIPGVNVNPNINWLDSHVGDLWWDLSNVKYIWYEQGELEYRKNNWNNIFPGSSIDVYEWVKSQYLPTEWSNIADTVDGLTFGICGKPKFNNNNIISVKQVYNAVSNSFQNVYYYWVKNTVVVPLHVKNRSISAFDVAKQIANPLTTGKKFLSVISPTSVMLANTKLEILSEAVNLNISFDSNKTPIKRHTEWQLVQENDATITINSTLEQKLIDSLLGFDKLGYKVPDPLLSLREAYGIQIRPRQSMFVNRIEALRNIIEFTNSVCKNILLAGQISFNNLTSKDTILDNSKYDKIVADKFSLELIATRNFISANLTAVIDNNGKISDVIINNPGYGYLTAPPIIVNGSGLNAEIISSIDQFGQITNITIVNGGYNYTDFTKLVVRQCTVVVQTDIDSNNKWAIYEWNTVKQSWIKIRTQDYDTTQYWSFINWNSLDYDSTIESTYTIASIYELYSLQSISTNSYVKVQNSGDGNYIILRKTDGAGGTFSNDWDIMVKQNGTIQFSDALWNQSLTFNGWDQNVGFDKTEYDHTPSQEISYIIHAIKNDIFIGTNKLYWNQLFFKAVKYAFSEQINLDWAFKTTFINVTNNAGQLSQPASYKLQNIQYFENYIEEIKPFHSKIRKFTESYTSTELSASFNSDFDLPSYYNTVTQQFNAVTNKDITLLTQYPWKSWYNNFTYQVNTIDIFDGGNGYLVIPLVIIVPAAGDTGNGATAVAHISLGKVSYIIVTNPGSGYTLTPTVIISGGGNQNLIPARAYAQLGSSPVRNTTIKLKFDRTTAVREIGNQHVTDSFISDGVGTTFNLSWVPIPDNKLISLKRNGMIQLIDSFMIEFTNESYNPQKTTSYIKKFATLKLMFIPDIEDIISITYPKNIELYNAASRIEDYYQPTIGMPGTSYVTDVDTGNIKLDLSQVMSGVEYSGLRVVGLPFSEQGGWDSIGNNWANNSWDNLDVKPGYWSIPVLTTSTSTVVIPDLITTGTFVNIYVNGTRIDSTSTSSLVKTIIGSGTGAVSTVTMLSNGLGYNPSYTSLLISAPTTPGGKIAEITATIVNGKINNITVLNPGSGYTSPPTINITELINPHNSTSTVVVKAYARVSLAAEFKEYNSTVTNTTLSIPSIAFTSTSNLIVLRYSTSDGTSQLSDDTVDSFISGGDMKYQTARGVGPAEIILDGGSTSTRHITGMQDDGFLNLINSFAPEECVPGQIQESIGINIYTQSTITNSITAFRVFNDILGRTNYTRINSLSSTILLKNLYLTDTVIYVKNSTYLTHPYPLTNKPGVILINGERIEFFIIVGNQLRQIRRGTMGTGPKDVHYAGEHVLDQGNNQKIPVNDLKQTTSTVVTTATATYSLNNWFNFNQKTDIYGRLNPDPTDQIEVKYQGITLLKPSLKTYKHNDDIAYDSTINVSSTSTVDVLVPYDFTIDVDCDTITLNTETVVLVEGAKLEILQRQSLSWYDNTGTIFDSTTPFANFITNVPADLPKFQIILP